jgi:hypothetical protein
MEFTISLKCARCGIATVDAPSNQWWWSSASLMRGHFVGMCSKCQHYYQTTFDLPTVPEFPDPPGCVEEFTMDWTHEWKPPQSRFVVRTVQGVVP